MEKILAVSEMTIKKAKEPAFSLLFIIAAVCGYFFSEMGSIALQDDTALNTIISVKEGAPLLAGFIMILLMTLLVAVFTGSTDIPRDIESRMIMIILSKPIRKGEYLMGKYLGILFICLSFFATASIVAVISHWFKAGEFYETKILIRQAYLVLAILPFVAMTMMISTLLSDIAAMIITAVYVMFSVSASTMSVFVDLLPQSLGVSFYVHVFAYFFPNFFYFLNSFEVFGLVALSLIFYSFSLTLLFLMLASIRLNSRDVI